MSSPAIFNSPPNDSAFNTWLSQLLAQGGMRQGDPMQDLIRQFLGIQAPSAIAALNYGSSLEPQREAASTAYLNNLENPQGMVDNLRTQLMGSANDQGNANANMLAEHGGGIGSQQGALLGARNQANTAANSFGMQLASPAGQESRMNALGQGFNAAYGNAPGNAMTFGQMAEQIRQSAKQRQMQGQSQGILGGLGPIISSFLGGGGFGNLFGGGGSSGPNTGGTMGDQSAIPPGGTSNWNGSIGGW